MTAPALAPGLSDFSAAPGAAVFVLPVVHVVIGGAVRSADCEEAGTAPIDPKPGKTA
jgi:hypothetical protein